MLPQLAEWIERWWPVYPHHARSELIHSLISRPAKSNFHSSQFKILAYFGRLNNHGYKQFIQILLSYYYNFHSSSHWKASRFRRNLLLFLSETGGTRESSCLNGRQIEVNNNMFNLRIWLHARSCVFCGGIELRRFGTASGCEVHRRSHFFASLISQDRELIGAKWTRKIGSFPALIKGKNKWYFMVIGQDESHANQPQFEYFSQSLNLIQSRSYSG